MTFQVGDRVRCLTAWDGNSRVAGQVGTVRVVDRPSPNDIGVEFDVNVGGHDLDLGYGANCERGFGWCISHEQLVLETAAPEKAARNIREFFKKQESLSCPST